MTARRRARQQVEKTAKRVRSTRNLSLSPILWSRIVRTSLHPRVISGLFVVIITYCYFTRPQIQPVDWNARREAVKNAFNESWNGYTEYAWGECLLCAVMFDYLLISGPT